MLWFKKWILSSLSHLEVSMRISDVAIKLCPENPEGLIAYASVTFDNAFVVHDLKVIDGLRGLFIAMPSRKLSDRCVCGGKNHLGAHYCNNCGRRLASDRGIRDATGRVILHADVAHPIHEHMRSYLTAEVRAALDCEWEKAQQPGYVCTYDERTHNSPRAA